MARWLDSGDRLRASQFCVVLPGRPLVATIAPAPRGAEVAEKLCMSLLEAHGKGAAKPVLVCQGNGRFWLGMIGLSPMQRHRHNAIDHLYRCLELPA